MRRNNKKEMEFDKNGFLVTNSWTSFEDIKKNLSTIKAEFYTPSEIVEEVKIRWGFNKVWYREHIGASEIPFPVEEWIKEGGFHQEQIGYDSRGGEWNTFPLYKNGDENLNRLIKDIFPKTYSVLKDVPGINFAAFFKQTPGSYVKRHKHTPKNAICHFLMEDLKKGAAWFKVGEGYKYMEKMGDAIGFDYRIEHSTGNNSENERVNLVVDIKIPD
tara:strand:- start:2247 stop:2894 length:648 start_codon:yes stop_codon:yes gene_type:complete